MARLFGFFRKEPITRRLEKITKGDIEEREKFIEEYIPFIIKTISDKMNKYIESENSEEYTIGMEAFNHAIDQYEASKGTFIGFAEVVIKNRIIDYLRTMSKHRKTIPISQFDEDEKNKIQNQFCVEDFTNSLALKDEIEEFEGKLKPFQITFSDLVKDAPKHRDTRINGIRIANHIAKNIELKEALLRKKTLPSTKLIKELGVTAKILKRSRKFIIATVLILDSDLEELKVYLSQTQGGVECGL